MKKTNINISVSHERKEEMKAEADKLGHLIGFRVTLSAFVNWLYEEYKKVRK